MNEARQVINFIFACDKAGKFSLFTREEQLQPSPPIQGFQIGLQQANSLGYFLKAQCYYNLNFITWDTLSYFLE